MSRHKVTSGGLGMVDIRAFDKCLKLTWIRKLITCQSNRKILIESLYPDLLQIHKYGNTFIYKTKNRIKNKFWNDLTSALLTFTDKYYLETGQNTNWYSFLYNDKIKIGN